MKGTPKTKKVKDYEINYIVFGYKQWILCIIIGIAIIGLNAENIYGG